MAVAFHVSFAFRRLFWCGKCVFSTSGKWRHAETAVVWKHTSTFLEDTHRGEKRFFLSGTFLFYESYFGGIIV
jgi:hypothetical protein